MAKRVKIETRDLRKSFGKGELTVHVLKGIDVVIHEGEWLAIMGRSGAGQSTLMYQLSLLDDATSGEIRIDGRDVHTLSEKEKMQFRLTKFGYVFQDYALLPELTALENVIVPLLMERYSLTDATASARASLEMVELGHRLGNLPSQLSGGEQQRVSIARAIAERPEILFADEPTANLDRDSSATVMELFKKLHENGQTLVMVTHEEEYGQMADRIIRIDDGRIIGSENIR